MSLESAGLPPEKNQDKKGIWLAVGFADDIEEGKGKAFNLPIEHGEKRIAVFRHEDEWFALEDSCSHARIPIVDGPIKDGCLMCPWHYAEFDLKTGAALSGPAVTAIASYPVRLTEVGAIEILV